MQSNNQNLTTGGSGGDYNLPTPKLNQTFSFDPYNSARRSNLNQTVVIENPTYLTNRESKLGSAITGTHSNNPMNQSVLLTARTGDEIKRSRH